MGAWKPVRYPTELHGASSAPPLSRLISVGGYSFERKNSAMKAAAETNDWQLSGGCLRLEAVHKTL